jgi:hypothetical protein
MNRPNADFGVGSIDQESCLDWKFDPTKEIDHLVIGRCANPGGAWNVSLKQTLLISMEHNNKKQPLDIKQIFFRNFLCKLQNVYSQKILFLSIALQILVRRTHSNDAELKELDGITRLEYQRIRYGQAAKVQPNTTIEQVQAQQTRQREQ